MVGLHTGDGVMVWGRVSAFMGRLLMSIWKLWDKLVEEGYAADHVFTMNETGLIYRCMPWRSYLLDGCDSRQANDRVTLLLCLNATGSFKIPPLMIGSTLFQRFTSSNTLYSSVQCLAGQGEVQTLVV